MPLTEKQQRFVEEYLVDLNATAAYQRAGYKATGGAARADASRLLTNANVQQAIEIARAKQQEKTELNAEYVRKGLQREAELTGEGSSPSARVSALSWLGKHFAMFTDVHEVAGKAGSAIELNVKAIGNYARYFGLAGSDGGEAQAESVDRNGSEKPLDTPSTNGKAGGLPHHPRT